MRVSYVQRPTMRWEAPWTRLRLTRDMKSRRRTTLLNGLSVPVSRQLFISTPYGVWLTAGEEAVELDEELEVDIVAGSVRSRS
jgi:hypothetical protein